MRVLLLFRGSPGCGKSTYIEEHGLKPYTLSADDIRMLCSSPTLDISGKVCINQENEKTVWSTLFKLLEIRMQNGEFTVIDATNSKSSEMNKYKKLAEKYRYRIYCIDMTDIPIEEAKRRNKMRTELKQVPDEVIDKMYSRFSTQNIPSGIKSLKPDELDTIWYKPADCSNYNKIHVIGDIHGCYTALNEYIENNGGIKDDELYIFTGDYVDRGIENADVVKFLCENTNKNNMIFIEGNHERHLRDWSNNITAKSKEFEFITKPQLIKAGILQKDVRNFCRKLYQCSFFNYHEKTFLITHGGISNVPMIDEDNYGLTFVATNKMIKGVGRYNDSDEVDKSFTDNMGYFFYQIHGHRNISGSPVQVTSNTFNVEGNVEHGGYLRAVQITKDNIEIVEVKNNIFKEPEEHKDEMVNVNNVDTSIYNLVNSMRNNRDVVEKSFGRISSFNFTRKAFEKNIWNSITNKARGLYIDTVDYKIVARSYNKFFNINQRPETKIESLRHKLQFPVVAYLKENGFLGIVGWDTEHDDLLITTKSSITGDYAVYFKNLLYSIYGEDAISKMKDYIRENNVSFVFECCDMINDPHIIEYNESKVILLDVIKNQAEYEKIPYDELVVLANNIGFFVKEKSYVIESWEDFYKWYNNVTAEDYKYNGENIEGFVIEDSNGYMVKVKLYYYNFWKHMRNVAHSVMKNGNYMRSGSLLSPIENEFFGWCKMIYNSSTPEQREEHKYTDIISLRNMFFDWRSKNNM